MIERNGRVWLRRWVQTVGDARRCGRGL